MNIILCGLPCSGKTMIGKQLSHALNLDFIDTDQMIVRAYYQSTQEKLSNRQIFQSLGEKEFRRLESRQIESLQNTHNSVIATGGGAIIDPQNIKVLKKIGTIIYLKTSTALIWQRLLKRGIPVFLNENNPEEDFQTLSTQRLIHYQTAADQIVDCHRLNEEDVLEEILNSLNEISQLKR